MIDVLVVGGIFREVLDGDTKPRLRYGGSGLTAAVAAARLGARVALAGYVGDEDQEAVRGELRAAGVNDELVATVPGASGTFVFPSREDRDRPWPMYRPAEAVPDSLPTNVPTASVVVTFGIPDFDPVAAGWLDGLTSNSTLVWDRQGWLSRARDTITVLRLPPSRKIYLANGQEAIDDVGADGIDEALAAQPPTGFEVAVIKRGIEGVVVVERTATASRSTAIPSFPVTAASTIGSGDIFAGAFAARLAKGDSPLTAAGWGCAASAIALESGTNLLRENAAVAVERLLLQA